jgi:glutamate mutase epsilon subunit
MLIQEEPVLKKVIIGNINDALFIAKGSTKNNISVAVNAKIINQLANNRISTTQGLDFTKKLVATELANVINKVVGNNNTSNAAHTGSILQVVVDNQATCSGIASPTNAACTLLVNIHGYIIQR